MDNLIVQKYGGSSLATLKQFEFVAKKVKNSLKNSNKIVIVVSAMGNTTDELVELGESFLKDSKNIENLRDFDQLLSTGEIISASLMSMSLRKNNVKAISLTGQKAGIFTDEFHGSARISSIDEKVILNELKKISKSSDNLIPTIISCIKNDCTLGEISNILRNVYGEYIP